MKKLFASVLSLAMACALVGCGDNQTATGATGDLTDGTYTAAVNGMNDLVEVTMTVADKKISSLEVTSDKETPGIGSPLCDKDGNALLEGGEAPTTLIPREVMEKGSLKVDNVTGATVTSGAIKAAIKDCLEQAGANLDEWNKEVKYDTR